MGNMVGFFALEETQGGDGYIGALLVTDDLGKPEEFRVTYPVKPSLVQEQLYGKSLLPHIAIELCGAPLYNALQHRNSLKLIVTADERFLGLADYIECRLVKLEREGKRLEVAEEADTDDVAAGDSVKGLRPTYPRQYSGSTQRETAGLIEAFSDNIDILEPFDRIERAVSELAQHDERFQ